MKSFSRLLDTLGTIVGWAFVCLTVIVLLRPQGIVREGLKEWIEVRRVNRFIDSNWPQLSRGDLMLGAVQANAGLVEFLDYQCQYCRLFHDSVTSILRAHPTAAVLIRQLPRPGDPLSRQAALSVVCAGEQHRFPDMHAHLLQDLAWRQVSDWSAIAATVGISDIDAFIACRRSPRAIAALSEDSSWAAKLAIQGTPALVTRAGGSRLGLVPLATVMGWLASAQ